MNGYDLGGAEWPHDSAEMTVVDILSPEGYVENHEMHGADWYKRDLNAPNWNEGLEPRANIYIGRVLRYLNNPYLAAEVLNIWDRTGTITIFDTMQYIDPFLANILLLDDNTHITAIWLTNPPSDGHDAEYTVVIEWLA